MFLRWFGVMMLAGALAMPGNVQAARGGHGGGGFSHGGGGFAHGGYGYGHGGFGYGRGYYGGFGLGYYPGFYGGYGGGGYYPYSSSYYAVPAYTEPYVVPSYSNVDTPPPAYTDAPVPAEPGSIAPATYTSAKAALVEVQVPVNAEVWIEGDKTQQTGEDRLFQSPPLQPDHTYSYDVKARWMDNGKVVERQRTVPVKAGERAVVDLRKP